MSEACPICIIEVRRVKGERDEARAELAEALATNDKWYETYNVLSDQVLEARNQIKALEEELQKTRYTVRCFAYRMRGSVSHDMLKEVRAAEQVHSWLRENPTEDNAKS